MAGSVWSGLVWFGLARVGGRQGAWGVVGALAAEMYSRASDRAIKLSQCGSGVGRGLGRVQAGWLAGLLARLGSARPTTVSNV